MNDLLRKFEIQSHIDVYGLGANRAKFTAALQRYTDMIVKECNEINKQELSVAEEMTLMKRYREHFGVEE